MVQISIDASNEQHNKHKLFSQNPLLWSIMPHYILVTSYVWELKILSNDISNVI